MNSMELPLVIFTVLSQAAIGLVIISSIRQFAAEGPAGNVRGEWLAALVLLLVGLTASLFHLGHPLGAVNAVKHLSNAWLSREAVGVSLFLALVIVGFFSIKDRLSPGLAALTAIIGLVALFFTAMTYAPPGYPAINNALPLVFFLLTAAVVGASVSSFFTSQEKIPLLRLILGGSLAISLVVYLTVPFVWLSGGTVMHQTGIEYLTSPLYWSRIIIGLALPLAGIWMSRSIPAWIPALVIIGEFMGRIAFFSLTLHASSNIGGL
ncbi:dimethyl sulfoxide reductase anchor subunit family protein [Desulfonatronovibrio hydrogenovorans]|uniref:dimethyl sulfoxide reductase anchor subunit family protein n=1 Tax=Desulfonatronovibrio hydrogenovorans TaxID=53245 RepID=UPI00048E7C5A|nr:DmsC/YnfH family molybdoenzyme membrane anchor subunit [Desulfonatronovibrio hydrogenovorans]